VLSAKEVCDIKKSLEVKSEQCVRFGMCTYFGFHLSVVTGKYKLEHGRVKKKYVQNALSFLSGALISPLDKVLLHFHRG